MIYGADAQVKVQGSVELSPLLLEFVERRVYHVKLNDVFMWGPNGIPSTDCVVHACSIGYNVESHNFVEEHRCVGVLKDVITIIFFKCSL